jgi:hypothetical protein
MGVGVSLFLIAIGAVLAFAVTAEISGLDIEVVGWILMAVGGVGLILSLLFWQSWGAWRRTTYVREDPYDRPPPY